MISFRYHLVSIIAVFLALALGVVVGTTGLNGAILSDLKKQVKNLRNENSSLRSSNDALTKTANNADAFASEYMKNVLTGRLAARTVVVVSAPGTDSKVKSGVEAALTAAGAKIVGRIQLSTAYVDPQRASDITNLATGPARPTGLRLPVTSDAPTLGAALLSYVLSGKGTPDDMGQVISGFTALSMLRVEGADPQGAQLAVVLTGGTYPRTDGRAKAMPALVSEFRQFGLKTVVAGDTASTTGAGLLAEVRADTSLNTGVSTVDDADTAIGQVSTALALAGLLTGQTGQYGTGPGVNSLFPPEGK